MMHPKQLAKPALLELIQYKTGVSPRLLKALASGVHVARLGSNENPYGASPKVYEAIRSVDNVHLYPDGGNTALRSALGEHVGVDADRIIVSTGSENVLSALFQCVVSTGDRVVTLAPTFLFAEIMAKAQGADRVTVSYGDDLGYDVEAIAEAAADDAKVVYISNPNNPTGNAFSSDELARIVDATSPSTLVVVDEAYFEYTSRHEGFESSLPVLDASGRPYIVLRTFSKAYGLAGLRVGYGITYHPDFVPAHTPCEHRLRRGHGLAAGRARRARRPRAHGARRHQHPHGEGAGGGRARRWQLARVPGVRELRLALVPRARRRDGARGEARRACGVRQSPSRTRRRGLGASDHRDANRHRSISRSARGHLVSYPELRVLVDGAWLERASGGTTPVTNPATGDVLGELPLVGPTELDACLQAAVEGYRIWRATPASERATVLERAAEGIRKRSDEIARWLTLEQGKPLAEAAAEVEAAAQNLEWNGRFAATLERETTPEPERGFSPTVQREPIGPVAALTPWNFPAMVPARKIAPALAAGCSVILKPAEETPATAIGIVEELQNAGAPVQLVCGDPAEVSAHLIASPVVRKISFTGSVPVGKHLARLAADAMKPGIWELGGHGPAIVLDDADIALAAATLARFKSRNAGQVCTAPSRFYVHDAVHDAFVDAFTDELSRFALGNGLESGVDVGPLGSERRVEAMERLVDDAVGRGARIALGGKRHGDVGCFFQLTVLTDVSDDAAILNEEPFGPVAPVVRFDGVDDVIAKANGLPYGLSAFVFTSSDERARSIVDALEAGLVQVNCAAPVRVDTPMGGVKDSGYGYEGGERGIDEYLLSKLVHRPEESTK